MLNSAVMTKPKRSVFAILDIGSSKTVCFVVKTGLGGTFKVLGIGYRSSEGFEGGSVADIKKASQSILSTVDLAEQVAEESVDQVYVSISGCGISSHNIFNEVNSTEHEISKRDIRRVAAQSYEKFDLPNVILHNIPVRYYVDSTMVNNPCGLYGSKIGVDMHVVTASRVALVNLEHCVVGCHLDLAGCIASSYASGEACLTEDEKDLGVAIIDIGGMYTSIGIFSRGHFVYADAIPVGGLNITRDIAFGLCIGINEAERIKIKYGNAVSTHLNCNASIDLSGELIESEQQYVQLSDLTFIIRPRVEEILDLSMKSLNSMGHLFRRIVITGGCSQMEGLKELSSFIFGKPVRLGVPLDVSNIDPIYRRNPIFSSAIGTAMLVSKMFFCDSDEPNFEKVGLITKIKNIFSK